MTMELKCRIMTFLAFCIISQMTALTWAQEWEMRICAETNNLPFSNRALEGFENRIAALLAEDLQAEISYVWMDDPRPLVRNTLIQQGDCDLVMATTDGHSGFLTTLAYYRSTYVFIYREDSPFEISSFDDPILHQLRIGVQMPGGRNVAPPTQALANRGLIPNQVGFVVDYRQSNPLSDVVQAVSDGIVDAGIAWGPVGGYYAKNQPVPLRVVPVSPEIELPFLPMVYSISIGVRPGDEELRDLLNVALARKWDEIQAVLSEFGVPLLPLPRPSIGIGGR